jgi:hypothetical protein
MPSKIAGIHQPNYIPWAGYFHKIWRSDVFIILDNVDFQQGNSKSITSRTRIKGANGEILLTVPIRKSESKTLNKIQIDTAQHWAKKHVKSIQLSYPKAPYFASYFPLVEELLSADYHNLAQMNIVWIKELCRQMDISTPILLASEMNVEEEGRNERIVKLCQAAGANVYLCGKGGRAYMEEEVFDKGQIQVSYTEFQPPAYNQLHGKFIPGLSIIDALMNLGKAGTLGLIKG